MTETEILGLLREHRTLGGAPEDELAWLAANATFRRLEAGTTLSPDAPEIVASLLVIFSGHLAIYLVRGGERRRAFEWYGGDVSGLLPYSRMTRAPGTHVVEETAEVLILPAERHPDLISRCHEITSRCVHVMVDRARGFTTTDLHDEKMASLGRMAAGLAHELNNPAAAVASSARALVICLQDADRAARALAEAGLDKGQLSAIGELCAEGLDAAPGHRSPLEQADYEDALADWLDEHDADPAASEALARAQITVEALQRLAADVQGPSLGPAVSWIAAICTARVLGLEVEEAASRVHDLVRAVQGFTDMDREMVLQPVDIGRGLATSLRILKYRAKQQGTSLALEVEDGLPPVRCFGGEMNQVWVNLVANAIDAAGKGGSVQVLARRQGNRVVVSVIDDGPGIASDVREHIFEPFYTTKKEGAGMGLGLDIVRRLLLRNEGELEIDSEPGRTEFRVYLPAHSRTGPS